MKFNEYIKQQRIKYFKNLEKFCKIIGVEKCRELLASQGRDFIQTYPKPESALDLAISAFEKKDFVDLASYEPIYLKAFKAGVAKDPFNLREKTSRFAQ